MGSKAIYIGLGSSAVVAAVCGSAWVPAATGCYTHQCDPTSVNEGFPGEDGGIGIGEPIDDDTWESSLIDQPWLPYPHMITYTLVFPEQFQVRQAAYYEVYIGTDQTPNGGVDFMNGDNMTPIAGQAALVNSVGACFTNDNGVHQYRGLQLQNASCADYFARIVVHFYPSASAAGTPSPCGVLPDAAPPIMTDAATGVVDSAGGGKPGM